VAARNPLGSDTVRIRVHIKNTTWVKTVFGMTVEIQRCNMVLVKEI
jgi:hypothetical protein